MPNNAYISDKYDRNKIGVAKGMKNEILTTMHPCSDYRLKFGSTWALMFLFGSQILPNNAYISENCDKHTFSVAKGMENEFMSQCTHGLPNFFIVGSTIYVYVCCLNSCFLSLSILLVLFHLFVVKNQA